MRTETRIEFKGLVGSCKTVHSLKQISKEAREINLNLQPLPSRAKVGLEKVRKERKPYAEELIGDLK